MEFQIANKMKTLFFSILSFFCATISFSQDKEFYTLYKGGEKVQKKIVYIYFNKDSIGNSVDIQNDTIYFVYEARIHAYGNSFETLTDRFQNKEGIKLYDKLNKNDIDNLIYSMEDLYKIEEKQIKKDRNRVENETGFKGLPPIGRHADLDIRICVPNNNEDTFRIYKVNWLYEVF
ncbi:hypothetical protein JoomaDRAFT_1647 [Galbibacter orientalis DSM 19592]|uniref:Uncharacterized protein n=1 Tax=Galbibacter orientalis DSM 19592 TaxID=926559 RepID=I3C4W6_9FLAO|nr:hypothetical protein [Galbibacter orientalis]EIJ38659.1 hypothetical protein JoomaDRAFT_1647 [Galbibacter orientalis DSM 19592]